MIEMTQAEVDEVIGRAREFCRAAEDGEPTSRGKGMLMFAHAVLHLAARQMPALRWVDGATQEPGGSGQHYCIGNIYLGGVFEASESSFFEATPWFADLNFDANGSHHATRAEAMAAVEAAVRKELGIGQIETLPLEPNAVVHAPGDLRAIVARLERERTEDRRRLAEAQTTIAKQAACLARHDLRPL